MLLVLVSAAVAYNLGAAAFRLTGPESVSGEHDKPAASETILLDENRDV